MKKFYLLLFVFLSIGFSSSFAASISLNFQFGPYCPNDTIAVNFNYDNYTAGNLVVFTAELSNSTGAFGSPTASNTISITIPTGGTGDTTIILTVPASPTFGNGYKIRVKTTSPNTISSSSSAFTINNFTISAGVDQTICAGSTVILNGTIGGGVSSATWSGAPAGNFSPSNTTLNATFTPTAAQIAALTATLTLTSSGLCAAINDVVTISINVAPTVNAGVDQTICSGSTATMSGSFGGGASSATWSTSGTGSFNNGSMSAVYTPSAADISSGSVTITLTTNEPAGPCTAVNNQMILTINAAATANAGVDQSVCAGTAVAMSGSFGGGASSATWTTSGTGSFNNNTSMSAVYTPSAADITAGTVTITLSTNDPAGPCVAVTNQMIITITPGATANAGVDQTICAGSTVTLNGSFGGSAASATWSSGGSGSFNNASSMTAIYTPSAADISSGAVTITLTTNNPAGPCNAGTDQMTLTINPIATVDAGPTQTICSNTTAQLDGTIGGGASTGTWTGGGTFTPNANTIDAIWTPSAAQIAAGTATLTLTTNDPAGPCLSVADNIIITINLNATSDAGIAQIICSNSTATLNGTIGGSAVLGTWSGGGTFAPNANTIDPVWTPSAAQITAGTATLTLTTNDPIGPCPAANDNVVITINAQATVDAGIDQTICAGTTATMNGNVGGGATSGSWTTSGTGTFNNSNSLTAIYTPSTADITAGTVTITLTTNDPAGPCIAVSNTMILTINQAATVNAGVDQAICAGSTATMSGTFGGSATSATWSSSGSGSFSNSSLLNAVYTPSAMDITNGTVTLTLTTNNPPTVCNAVTDQMILTINPAAVANANIDQVICAGTNATLNGSISGGASSGTWTSNGTGTFNNSSSMNAVYTPSAADISAGSVILTLTTNNPTGPCNAVSDIVIITINTAASVNAGIDETICADGTVNLNGLIGGSALSATWSTNGNGSFNNNTSLFAVYTPGSIEIASGTVTLTLTTDNPTGPCNAVLDQVVITILPLPVISITPVSFEICSGDTTTLHVNSTGTTQATSFNWQPAGLLNVSSGVDVIASVTNATASPILQVFSVIGSSSLGCTAFADVTITINPLPAVPVINGKNSICAGEANVLYTIAPPLTATDIFSWSATPAGINAFVSNGNHDTCLVDFSGVAGGVASCNLIATVTTTAFGCKSFAAKNISIGGQSPPLEPVIEFSTNPFTLAVLYSQAGTNYRWGRDFISNFNQDTVGFNNEFGNQNLQLFLVPDTNATPLHFDQFYYWVEYYNTDINCKQKAYYNIDSASLFQSLTGIQNKIINSKNYFFVYPNPTDGIFILQFEGVGNDQKDQLIIYDLSGKEMENITSDFNSNRVVINSDRKYPPGIYFVKYINYGGGCQISKIIIQ